MRRLALLAGALAAACSDDPRPRPDDQAAERALITGVPARETWSLPGLGGEAHVLRTEGNVPHVYARDRRDLALVQGFVMARDRYLMIALAARLGRGTLGELFGDAALAFDVEARQSGMAFVADRILEGLTPELEEIVDAFAAGINAYVARVQAGELRLPVELDFAGPLLGKDDGRELVTPVTRRDVGGMLAVVLYQSGYETGDVDRAAAAQALPGLFEGAALGALREAGARADLWERIEPIYPIASAGAGFGLDTGPGAVPPMPAGAVAERPVPALLFQRLGARLARQRARLKRDPEVGFGSNAWAVAGSATTDGASLLAGDGHLSLAVPTTLYQIGVDTRVFGGGDTHQLGLLIPGMPIVGLGTNGRVAWSQTQVMGDITDWYREELRLDAAGLPEASRFRGEWRPLERVDDVYVVAEVPALGSAGRTETWPRWTTFDGRWIREVEGRTVTATEPARPGEAVVNLQGTLVVPGDVDGDGVVTAISFDYTGLDATGFLRTLDALGHAADVHAFRQASRGLVASSLNFVASDALGNVYYSSYQAVPCRRALPRNADGSWAAGADPGRLLDGTVHGGFRVPFQDGAVDERDPDPSACVVPFEATPAALSPDRGYVATANNDPGGASFDGALWNDPWYVGGTWDVGWRIETIASELARVIAAGQADVAAMTALQKNVRSAVGRRFAPYLVEAIAAARAASGGPLRALYQADAAAFDEVADRLRAWGDAGYQARSGVETFYAAPTAQDRTDAVATTLFNAWIGRFVRGVFDDEGLPHVWHPGSADGKLRALLRFLERRDGVTAEAQASFNADTGESAFFDVLGTPAVETSREVMLRALADALAYLRAAPARPGEGGYGTPDMSRWLWGLRHYVRFESLFTEMLGADSQLGSVTDQFAITTDVVPLASSLAPGDPRADLKWFPRDGDQESVDAASPGLDGERFSYGSGPVMRMVFSLKGDQVGGRIILPGGQSGESDSPHFADQVRLWLANDYFPVRFSVPDVVAGATAREHYLPAP